MLTRFPGPSGRSSLRGAAGPQHRRALRLRAGTAAAPSPMPGSRWGTSTCSATPTAWCAARRPSPSWSTHRACCPRWSCRPRRPRSERPSSRCGTPGWDELDGRAAPARRAAAAHHAALAQATPGPASTTPGRPRSSAPSRLADVLERQLPADAAPGQGVLVGRDAGRHYDQLRDPVQRTSRRASTPTPRCSPTSSPGASSSAARARRWLELVFMLGVGLLLGSLLPRACAFA